MIDFELWKPCLLCPYAAIEINEIDVKMLGNKQVNRTTVILCGHADVCAMKDGAEKLSFESSNRR